MLALALKKVYIGRGYMPLVDFRSLSREGVLLRPFFSAFFLLLIVYDLCNFVCLLRLYNTLSYLSKIK